ncbi:mCG11472, isoform CRA_b [Mus musculus]|nr:mCG11472, isoform CRA_b [Mus musculus]
MVFSALQLWATGAAAAWIARPQTPSEGNDLD